MKRIQQVKNYEKTPIHDEVFPLYKAVDKHGGLWRVVKKGSGYDVINPDGKKLPETLQLYTKVGEVYGTVNPKE